MDSSPEAAVLFWECLLLPPIAMALRRLNGRGRYTVCWIAALATICPLIVAHDFLFPAIRVSRIDAAVVVGAVGLLCAILCIFPKISAWSIPRVLSGIRLAAFLLMAIWVAGYFSAVTEGEILVIDQNGHPVVGATLEFCRKGNYSSWSRERDQWYPWSRSTGMVTTNESGHARISFLETDTVCDIRFVSDGFRGLPSTRKVVLLNRLPPQDFHCWRLVDPGNVVSFKLIIPMDSTERIACVDLVSGKWSFNPDDVPDADLHISLRAPRRFEGFKYVAPLDWIAMLGAPRGLVTTSADVMYLAPRDGYEPFYFIAASEDALAWDRAQEARRNGERARIQYTLGRGDFQGYVRCHGVNKDKSLRYAAVLARAFVEQHASSIEIHVRVNTVGSCSIEPLVDTLDPDWHDENHIWANLPIEHPEPLDD